MLNARELRDAPNYHWSIVWNYSIWTLTFNSAVLYSGFHHQILWNILLQVDPILFRLLQNFKNEPFLFIGIKKMEGNCILGYSKQMPFYNIWWETLRELTKLKSVDRLDPWIFNTSLWWNRTEAKLRLYVNYTSLRAVFYSGKSTGCALSKLVQLLKVLSPIFCLTLVKNIMDSYSSLLNYNLRILAVL